MKKLVDSNEKPSVATTKPSKILKKSDENPSDFYFSERCALFDNFTF